MVKFFNTTLSMTQVRKCYITIFHKVINFSFIYTSFKNEFKMRWKLSTVLLELYLLLSAFSSSKLCRTLRASSSWAVGVCVMSSGAGGASIGSARLWNNLCLRDTLVGVAQAAALALRMEEGHRERRWKKERTKEEYCECETGRAWWSDFYLNCELLQ